MADEALVKMLTEKGVKVWNEWRESNPYVVPDLSEAYLVGAHLRNANLSVILPYKSAIEDAIEKDFADSYRKDWGKATLARTLLVGTTDPFRTNLYHADLTGADLQAADLSFADLTWAHLGRANLRDAKLQGSRLWFSEFQDTELAGANFTGATFGWTKFADTNLGAALGLKEVKHAGPSSIGIDTMFRSEGRVPKQFLISAGVPDSVISSSNLFKQGLLQYSSCFISYSSRDHKFAERLHADLQSKGVRCWFAPEDLKIGEKFRTRIEESIRLYDKLMVVLSENSIQSTWVEEEVEAALEKERYHPGTTVLFPIRLDDAVMDTKQAWAASLRRTRHIGEFNDWKNHDRYKKAFDRLLRDLKAQDKVHSSAK